MRFKYISVISVVTILSLGCLGVLAPKAKSETRDTNYKLETLKGDMSELDLSWSAIVKSGRDSYWKVTLEEGEFTSKETLYDAKYHVDGDQLENRELYRHMIWPNHWENDEYVINWETNYTYMYSNSLPTVQMATLNKETNLVQSKQIEFNDLANEWYYPQGILEVDSLYYLVMEDDYDRAVRIYTFDPDTLEVSLAFEYPFETEGAMGYMTYVTDHYVYCAVYLEDGEMSNELVRLDVQKQKATTVQISDIDFGFLKGGSEHLFLEHNQDLYLFDEREERVFDLESPSFVTEHIRDDYYTSIEFTEDYLVVNYCAIAFLDQPDRDRNQYIAVYDLENHQLIYEGNISLLLSQEFMTESPTFSVN